MARVTRVRRVGEETIEVRYAREDSPAADVYTILASARDWDHVIASARAQLDELEALVFADEVLRGLRPDPELRVVTLGLAPTPGRIARAIEDWVVAWIQRIVAWVRGWWS